MIYFGPSGSPEIPKKIYIDKNIFPGDGTYPFDLIVSGAANHLTIRENIFPAGNVTVSGGFLAVSGNNLITIVENNHIHSGNLTLGTSGAPLAFAKVMGNRVDSKIPGSPGGEVSIWASGGMVNGNSSLSVFTVSGGVLNFNNQVG